MVCSFGRRYVVGHRWFGVVLSGELGGEGFDDGVKQ